jgi:hypothetical protein
MLRITKTTAATAPTIVLEGRLVGPWVAELQRLTTEGEGAAPPPLDLAALGFADAQGIALLRALRARGFELRGASSFLAALIGEG